MTKAEQLHHVGSVWEIESEARVSITAPNGSTSIVAPTGKVALYVLAAAGTYRADLGDGSTVEIEVKAAK